MCCWERPACQRKALPACAIASLVLSAGLLIFTITYLRLGWRNTIGEDPTFDLKDGLYDDCRPTATAVTANTVIQAWDTSTDFSQAWSDAEQKAREPAHTYMEKRHSVAIYMYTNTMLRPATQRPEGAQGSAERLQETSESRSFYSSLSEAIQVLKHSQVTCLTTSYRTLSRANISDKHIRFSTFILGSDGWSATRNASCFEVYTCFGADVTYYSALKLNRQVLIPPYEVFRVTEVEADAQMCEVVYRLKSNLNCVYDRGSDTLHPISASSGDGFWLFFTITCVIIVSLFLPFVTVKVLGKCKRTAVYTDSCVQNSTYCPAPVF